MVWEVGDGRRQDRGRRGFDRDRNLKGTRLERVKYREISLTIFFCIHRACLYRLLSTFGIAHGVDLSGKMKGSGGLV